MRLFLWFLSPVLLLLAALPAAARPRDDALAGAFRCAVIGDARAWLDCYYGAAQPVRAGLGLAPATAAQVKLALAPPAFHSPAFSNGFSSYGNATQRPSIGFAWS